MERVLLSLPPLHSRHGTALFLGSEKRCIHDGSITRNKQTSEQAMHCASWVSMKSGVGSLNGSSLSMPLRVRQRTECIYMIV